jgi:hypothetical protein
MIMNAKQIVKENWKPVTISGMTGILMGAGSLYASQVLATDEKPSVVELNELPLKEASVEGCKSFRDAFEAARAEFGPGAVFRWHGNIYNTYTSEEWNALSTEEKNQFAQRVKPEVSPADIDTKQIAEAEAQTAVEAETTTDEDVQVAPVQEEDHVAKAQVVTEEPAPTNSDEDDDVRVIGFGDVNLADGRSVTVEELEINGQRVAVIDVDKDGVGDFAMSDMNHNNRADEGEVIDLHTGDAVSFHNDQTAIDDSAADVDMIPV